MRCGATGMEHDFTVGGDERHPRVVPLGPLVRCTETRERQWQARRQNGVARQCPYVRVGIASLRDLGVTRQQPPWIDSLMQKQKTEIRSGFRSFRLHPRERGARLLLACQAAALAIVLARGAEAQVKPNSDWRTIRTEHFYIHFTPDLEALARRAATQAETAFVELSRHLTKPRGKIDIVISDDVDYSNGWATPFPSNRIGIYANPPVFEGALRFTDDPTDLVVTHELTHIFHLDRASGIWGTLQRGLGRVAFFFPNAYQPRWLVEGLAVYYESLLTGSGRIVGSEHHMIARTAALAHNVPRLDQLSIANPYFPYGYSAYAYGSLFVDHLARTYGDRAMRTFVESSSRQLIPLWLNWPARRAFGRRMTSAWRVFADSLLASNPTAPGTLPMPEWRDLTVDGAYASFPRWLNDSTLVYTGSPGRETYGAYTLRLQSPTQRPPPTRNAERDRIGRRNSRSPNTVLPNGALLFSQLEYNSPYTLRSDLYVSGPGRGTRRLTRGARLALPDARADGRIVAVQTIPAGTRVALVSADGKVITPITNGGMDEQWSEPRWSPDGNHIAAVRWTRGGTNEVVVLDTTGNIVQTLVRERTVNATPSWSPDGKHVYFSSDRGGITNLYRAPFRGAFADTQMMPGVERVSDAKTGLFEPQLSPNGSQLAASVFKADGYHVGIAPLASARPESAPAIETVAPRNPPPITQHLAPSSKYSPFRSLAPTYWIPYLESALDSNSVRYGAFTSGSDIVGRHAYQASLFVPSDNSGLTGSLFYRNAILGQPLVDFYFSQDWENRGCIVDSSQQNLCVGVLRRRIQDATLALTLQRLRARTFSYVSLGTGMEVRDYAADSAPLLLRIDSIYRRSHYYPRAVLSAGWSNTQHPPLAISPEDGVSLSGTARLRHRLTDSAAYTLSLVGSSSAFKSLDLPGYGHHVLALHAAGGVQDNRGTGYFEVGGVSGGSLDVLPGYVLGEGRRTFGVRGFPAGSLFGIRAFKASAEYRAPFVLPGRGLGSLPLFLDRTGITLFGDIASAWCPGIYATRPAPGTSLCTSADADAQFVFLESHPIASAGAELSVLASILSWDAPFRYRLGYAVPVLGMNRVPGTQKPTAYFTVGASF